MITVYLFLIFAWVLILGIRFVYKTLGNPQGFLVGVLYVLALLIFCIGLMGHTHSYKETIMAMVDFSCYNPFSEDHILSLIVYFILFNVAVVIIYKNGNQLPPLTLVIFAIFLILGAILSFVMLFHLSEHDTSKIDVYNGTPGDSESKLLFLFYPLSCILISIYLLYKIIKEENVNKNQRSYSNSLLNRLNRLIIEADNLPIFVLILVFPVIIIITLILMLFGQDVDSISKVFTETTLWRLSQYSHPQARPYVGHYLCTVAAKGNPKIVKPLRMGKRQGTTIIVNRQLLISNAFEEMIQDYSPKIHHIIRSNYDKYGYDLSKKIDTPTLSNLTYLLMKPLEWGFLICLYLFCNNPEQKINKQYCE